MKRVGLGTKSWGPFSISRYSSSIPFVVGISNLRRKNERLLKRKS
jgi:hypothetical protein